MCNLDSAANNRLRPSSGTRRYRSTALAPQGLCPFVAFLPRSRVALNSGMTKMTIDKRSQKRSKMVIPVKMVLPGTSLFVHTLDVSTNGVRIGALRQELRPGQMVSLSRGTKKAQFRIVWIEQRGHEFHAGLEAIQPNEKFWGVDLNAEDSETGQKAFLKVLRLATGR
jgi:PilZ domain